MLESCAPVQKLPTVKVTRKTLLCQAYGFYPKEIDITWRKDGEVRHEDTFCGVVSPKADGTYGTWCSIEVDPKVRSRYQCHVEYGLQEPLDVTMEESVPVWIISVGVSMNVLLVLIVVAGLILSRKKWKTYKAATFEKRKTYEAAEFGETDEVALSGETDEVALSEKPPEKTDKVSAFEKWKTDKAAVFEKWKTYKAATFEKRKAYEAAAFAAFEKRKTYKAAASEKPPEKTDKVSASEKWKTYKAATFEKRKTYEAAASACDRESLSSTDMESINSDDNESDGSAASLLPFQCVKRKWRKSPKALNFNC